MPETQQNQQTITEAIRALRAQMGANTAAQFKVPLEAGREPVMVYIADSPAARLILGAAWETVENWAAREARKNAEAQS